MFHAGARVRWIGTFVAFACLALAIGLATSAQDAEDDKPQAGAKRQAEGTSDRAQLLAEQQRLLQEQNKLLGEKKHAEALAVIEKRESLLEEIAAKMPDLKRATDEQRVDLYRSKALLLLPLEKPGEAIQAAQAGTEAALRAYGDTHWKTADSRTLVDYCKKLAATDDATRARMRELEDKASAAAEKGRFRDAIQSAEQLKEIEARVLGVEHPYYANSLVLIASWLEETGDLNKAKEYYERNLAIREKAQGIDHPDYVRSLHRLAYVCHSMREYAQAEPLLRQILEIRKKVVGQQHPDYAASLTDLGVLYRDMDDYARAEPLLRKALELRKNVLGEEHPDYAATLNSLATLYIKTRDYARAEPLLHQALEINKQTHGVEHPDYATSLGNLGSLYQAMGQYARAEPLLRQVVEIRKKVVGEQHPDYALSLNNLGSLYDSMGEYARAEPLYLEALAIRKKVCGREHPDYATSLNNLGLLYDHMANFARAEPLLREALEVTKKIRGKSHPSYALRLNNLGALYQTMGDYARAEPLLQKAAEVTKKALGRENDDYALKLNNLGALYESMGDYARAEPLYREAIEIDKKVLGEQHPGYATNLNNLGSLYDSMGDHAQAEPLFRQALEIRKKALGEKHPRYAEALNNLGHVYGEMGDPARAEPLYRQAAAIRLKALGREHPSYAGSLNNLAGLYVSMRQYARAEPLYRQTLAICEKALGKAHPYYAHSLNNLGFLYTATGDYAQAAEYFSQALEVRKKALGDEHPSYATTLGNLGELYESMGEFKKAEPLYRQALGILRSQLELTADVQSERQQLAMAESFQHRLHSYVSLASRMDEFAEAAFRQSLGWKGAVLARQRRLRAVVDEPELEPLWNKLQSAAAQLAKLALMTPDPKSTDMDAWRRQIIDLSAEKEKLEAELAGKSAAFREARKPVTLEDLQAAMPADVALVDFLEYGHWTPPAKGTTGPGTRERRFAAFVVRAHGPVRLVNLGPVEPISEAIDTWRTTFGTSRASADAGRLLRQKIWEPLEEHIEGAKIVLVAPDGALGRMPLAALPGKEPGTFLLEERALAVLPVPQLLPALVNEAGRKQLDANVLLLGGVDYGADPDAAPKKPHKAFPGSKRSVEQSWRGEFTKLDATEGEIATVESRYRELFGDEGITVLKGAAASEAALRAEAPRHLFLHLATHGFFAPAKLKSAWAVDEKQEEPGSTLGAADEAMDVAGLHPGLLSGVVLAGANRPPRPDGDDGILTAEEVALLNLSGCRMCVLSACETGLGEVAGGEGLLGLQRAFQVAGARSTVSSLWKVDDTATRSLMERFYKNLWEREMPAVEALREAQIWMLRDKSNRGLAIDDQPADDSLPPYYWAAFVLSGDWR